MVKHACPYCGAPQEVDEQEDTISLLPYVHFSNSYTSFNTRDAVMTLDTDGNVVKDKKDDKEMTFFKAIKILWRSI